MVAVQLDTFQPLPACSGLQVAADMSADIRYHLPDLLLRLLADASDAYLITDQLRSNRIVAANRLALTLLRFSGVEHIRFSLLEADPQQARLFYAANQPPLSWTLEPFSPGAGQAWQIWRCVNLEDFPTFHPDSAESFESSAEPSFRSALSGGVEPNDLLANRASNVLSNESIGEALVENCPTLLFVCTPDAEIVTVNPAVSQLLGISIDDMVHRPLISIIYPDDMFRVEEAFMHVWTSGVSINCEARMLSKAQQLRTLNCTLVADRDRKLVLGYAQDITDRKSVDRIDRDLRTRFEAVYNKAQDAIMLTTPYGRIIQVNPAAANVLGYTTDELAQISLDELLIKRIRPVRLLEAGGIFENDQQRGLLELKRKDGQVVICSFTQSENILPGINLYIMTDITELEHSRRQIQQQKQRMEATLDSIGDAFFTVDNNWVITYWNRLAEERFSLPRQTVVGKKMWDIFGTDADSEYVPYYLEAMREKVPVYFENYSKFMQAWFEVSVFPNDLGLSAYIKDITSRKVAEERLKELNVQLDRKAADLASSNAELERFAYVASHDLQEPLRMVSSFLQLLQRKYQNQIDELSSKYIDFAVDGAERMKQLINDLLEYSRISLQEVRYEPVDMQEVAQEVITLMANRAADAGAHIVVGDLPVIKAQRLSMVQLLQNLVGNALKYHRSDVVPEVRITGEQNLLEWKFTVSDNGIGIDRAFQEKIFIIFQRLHNREEYSGTGIGLAICKKIVDHYGGRIWVDSIPGEGSHFHFTIPHREFGA